MRWRLSVSQKSTSVYTRMQRQMTYPREISWSITYTMSLSSTKMKTSGEMCVLDLKPTDSRTGSERHCWWMELEGNG